MRYALSSLFLVVVTLGCLVNASAHPYLTSRLIRRIGGLKRDNSAHRGAGSIAAGTVEAANIKEAVGIDEGQGEGARNRNLLKERLIPPPILLSSSSAEWRLALLRDYLMRMKPTGYKFLTVNTGVSKKSTHGYLEDKNIVCKVAPYRVCYRMDGAGKLMPLGKAQPVNILRVY